MSVRPTASLPEVRAGDVLGGYRIESLVGEGGMGLVFRATRRSDGTRVALKVMKSHLCADEIYCRRFLREARTASRVSHKHLVPIVEFGEERGRYFLAARYVSGGSLENRLEREAGLPVSEVIPLCAQIASGLGALHREGIVHRDIKPANIMLDDQLGAAITDFGLAKGRAATLLTEPGKLLGTVDYMAPELIQGQEATAASDIYALGCLVYECLTGAPLFADRSPLQVSMAHLDHPPPNPRERRPDLPAAFADAMLLALAKNPVARPRTATAYANMLTVAQTDGG